MSTHLRQQILLAAAALVTNLATAGTNVFVSRVLAVDKLKMPCLLVSLGEEIIARNAIGFPAQQMRQLVVVIRPVARGTQGDSGNNDLDAQLNAMALDVEQAIAASKTAWQLNGLLRMGLDLQQVSEPEFDEGDKLVASIEMRFVGTYQVAANAPQTPL